MKTLIRKDICTARFIVAKSEMNSSQDKEATKSTQGLPENRTDI